MAWSYIAQEDYSSNITLQPRLTDEICCERIEVENTSDHPTPYWLLLKLFPAKPLHPRSSPLRAYGTLPHVARCCSVMGYNSLLSKLITLTWSQDDAVMRALASSSLAASCLMH